MPRLTELPWLLVIWSAHRRVVEGCDVRVAESGADVDEVFVRVKEALRLIVRYGPRFHARLRRDVKRLLFNDMRGANYIAGLQTCRVGVDYPPLELAMMIVHEATHARLSKAGFKYVVRCRERIERMCVEAEITFAERVPGSEAAISRVRGMLATQWWTSEHIMDARVKELAERGVPTWLVTILRWVGSRRRTR